MATDLCIGFLLNCWPRLFDFPEHAHVLEIGCSEADSAGAIKRVRPDVHITGIDWRKAPECHADEIVRGDVLITQKFGAQTFDAVIAVSTIEHIGLSGYGDPIDADGDSIAMRRIGHEWLKPGGICYLDVPYRPRGPYGIKGKAYRAYDPIAIEDRLIRPSGLERIGEQLFDQTDHPDGPYLALVLKKTA